MSVHISTNTETSPPSITYIDYTFQPFNAYFIDMSDKSNNEQPETFCFTSHVRQNTDNAIIRQSKNMFSGIHKKNCHRRCKNKYR